MAESSLRDTEDLRRARLRRLLAGGAALSLASVIAAVWLFSEPNRLQPSDPPEPTTQLLAPQSPLVAPETPLEVRELGFHVEPAAGVSPNQDWSLAPTHQETTVEWAGHMLLVRVYYEGTRYPDLLLNAQDGGRHVVSVHGVPGTYFEQFGKVAADDSIDFSAGTCGTPPLGCDVWQSQLIWEFAPGSWASVYGETGESPPQPAAIRPAFLKVAEAVRSGGGATTRVPFRVGPGLSPLSPPTETGVGMRAVNYPGTSGWLISFYGEPTLEFSVSDTLCSPNLEDPSSTVQPFTYRGNKGCLSFYEEELSGVALRVDGVDRKISNLFRNDDRTKNAAELKQWLADLTIAPLDDPTTWFDLKSAFRG